MKTAKIWKYELPEEIMMSPGNQYLKLLFLFQAMVVNVFCKSPSDEGNLKENTQQFKEKLNSNLSNAELEDWMIGKVLTKIAKVTLKHHQSPSLLQVLSDELLEIIGFIDKNMSASRINSERKNKFAKAPSRGRGFKSIEEKILKNAQLRNIRSNLPQALKVIKELKDAMPNDIVKEEVRVITDFINRHGYETMEDLQNYMEQLFADMMNKFLVQFPNAIYRELTECYLEEYEEKVRMA
ncbi:hypothetical protein Syun_030669 [Stephania yunnanensis]|uniref:Uncharacterized protein n=1 Tax=Stephania yunnanensis TaxID=152371 RepID=A0AAP0DUK0_9MAGN